MTWRTQPSARSAALGGAQVLVGPLLATLGSALLLISLFIDWYEPSLTAWTTFETLDLVLALVALAGLAVGLAALAVAIDAPGRALGRLGVVGLRRPVLPALGAVALVVVLSQVLHRPPTVVDDASREAGAWVALAASALLALGGVLASLRVEIDVRPRDPADVEPGTEPMAGYPEGPAGAPPPGAGRPPRSSA